MDEGTKIEFIGQIIDTFEDYLTKKGIADKNKGFITGKDYDGLSKDLEEVLTYWGVIKDNEPLEL